MCVLSFLPWVMLFWNHCCCWKLLWVQETLDGEMAPLFPLDCQPFGSRNLLSRGGLSLRGEPSFIQKMTVPNAFLLRPFLCPEFWETALFLLVWRCTVPSPPAGDTRACMRATLRHSPPERASWGWRLTCQRLLTSQPSRLLAATF